MSNLKPYRVGDYDVVAAETPEQALSLLKGEFDLADDEIDIEDVEDLSPHLDFQVHDEEGNPTGTLRDYVDNCNGKPSYLYGWG